MIPSSVVVYCAAQEKIMPWFDANARFHGSGCPGLSQEKTAYAVRGSAGQGRPLTLCAARPGREDVHMQSGQGIAGWHPLPHYQRVRESRDGTRSHIARGSGNRGMAPAPTLEGRPRALLAGQSIAGAWRTRKLLRRPPNHHWLPGASGHSPPVPNPPKTQGPMFRPGPLQGKVACCSSTASRMVW